MSIRHAARGSRVGTLRRSAFCTLAAALLLCARPAVSQADTPAPQPQAGGPAHATPMRAGRPPAAPVPAMTPSERRAAEAFDQARGNGLLALHAFLERMPKGADLHMHLSGAVYAETFLKNAVEDKLCVDTTKLAFVKNSGVSEDKPLCPDGSVDAATAFKDQHLYDALVDSFSMRAFVPTPGVNGHDQFFATFARFGGLSKAHAGEWLDEVATRAAAQNEQYLEIMQTPTFTHAAGLGYKLGWPAAPHPVSTADSTAPDDIAGTAPEELAALRTKLLAAGLRDEVAGDRAELAQAEQTRQKLERCGTQAATPACAVEVRFLYQVLRAFPPQQVFAQTLLGFEVAQAELDAGSPLVVGINFVQPEDAYNAMTEYHRQMRMLDYLHSVYPRVHVALHAGELAPGLVPPAGLRFHIRQAVELGHAERIGHGVDVMYERDPAELLAELSARHVMIELNLTSNEVILGVATNHHALPAYRAARVPVALSTDDEGVSRIDLTHEYARSATEFGLSYLDLKQMARTSVEHTFLPGASLWAAPDDFSRPAAACAGQPLGAQAPSTTCAAYLKASPHAAQQWELERRYAAFETTLPEPPRYHATGGASHTAQKAKP